MKKGKSKSVFGIFLVLSLISFVSAQFFQNLDYQVENIIYDVISILRPIFEVILGDYSGSEFFLVKVLLLLMLFIMINFVLRKVEFTKDMGPASSVIALIVSILAVRFMPDNQIFAGILLPYNVLGVALTSILPFLIFFYFVHSTNMTGAGRRISWAIFGIIFVALYFTRSDISPVVNYIYLGIIGMVVLAILFDRGIQRYFSSHELNVFLNKQKGKAVASLQAEYMNILNVDTSQAKQRRDEIESKLRELGAGVP
jgi:hypothetical protein